MLNYFKDNCYTVDLLKPIAIALTNNSLQSKEFYLYYNFTMEQFI
ncbi:hypothetical protein JM81_0501 [Maribacter sp. MAR_2009_72]|nr:hypothetical protein JM81_0501 [Maribacter sp. MAR_2009_72]